MITTTIMMNAIIIQNIITVYSHKLKNDTKNVLYYNVILFRNKLYYIHIHSIIDEIGGTQQKHFDIITAPLLYPDYRDRIISNSLLRYDAKSDRNHSSSSILLRFNIHSRKFTRSSPICIEYHSILCLVNITTTGCNFDCIDHLQYYMLSYQDVDAKGNGTLWKTIWNLLYIASSSCSVHTNQP